jgi:hypothetical protein
MEFGTRQTCLSQFCHLGGTHTEKPLHQYPDGTRIGQDPYCASLARFVLDNRLDAIQTAKAWTRAGAFLASSGSEPATGKGFAFLKAPLPYAAFVAHFRRQLRLGGRPFLGEGRHVDCDDRIARIQP